MKKKIMIIMSISLSVGSIINADIKSFVTGKNYIEPHFHQEGFIEARAKPLGDTWFTIKPTKVKFDLTPEEKNHYVEAFLVLSSPGSLAFGGPQGTIKAAPNKTYTYQYGSVTVKKVYCYKRYINKDRTSVTKKIDCKEVVEITKK